MVADAQLIFSEKLLDVSVWRSPQVFVKSSLSLFYKEPNHLGFTSQTIGSKYCFLFYKFSLKRFLNLNLGNPIQALMK